MKPKARATIAVFDFDRTLTRRGTFTPFLLFAARSQPWRYLFLIPAGALALLYLAGLLSRKRLKELMIGCFLAGKPKAGIDAVGAAFSERLLKSGVHAKAIEAVRRHQKQGHVAGLATASMDFYVRHVALALKLDFAIATRSTVDARGRLRAKIAGENCYGEAKAVRLREFLAKAKPKEIWFYSDHASDRPSFALADRKVAVNPGPRLASLAKGPGWRIEWWD